MGRRDGLSLFETHDTGSNNSNSSSSEDRINSFGRLTWESIPPGIPTHCYCGEAVVVRTHTQGAHNGRRFYSCSGPMDDGECHIWRLWDDAIMEEITSLKQRISSVQGRLLEWIGSPEHMSPATMWELFHSCAEEKKKLKALIKLQENSDMESSELKKTVKELQTKVFEDKKMQLTTRVLVCATMVLLCATMVIVILVLFKTLF